jgi:hypothetical protein
MAIECEGGWAQSQSGRFGDKEKTFPPAMNPAELSHFQISNIILKFI